MGLYVVRPLKLTSSRLPSCSYCLDICCHCDLFICLSVGPPFCLVLCLFSLVSFLPVCITDKECMFLALRAADSANGFALGNYAANERGYPLQLDTEEERQNL